MDLQISRKMLRFNEARDVADADADAGGNRDTDRIGRRDRSRGGGPHRSVKKFDDEAVPPIKRVREMDGPRFDARPRQQRSKRLQSLELLQRVLPYLFLSFCLKWKEGVSSDFLKANLRLRKKFGSF